MTRAIHVLIIVLVASVVNESFAISGLTDIYWLSSITSGEWTNTTSWTGGAVPTSSSTAFFKGSGMYDVTLGASKTVGAVCVQANGGALKVNMDFSPYTLTGTGGSGWNRQFIVFGPANASASYGADVEIVSGKATAFACVNVGAYNNGPTAGEYGRNRFAVSGQGTTFTCTDGKQATEIGYKGNYNAFEVLGGASFKAGSGTIIGNGGAANYNVLRVSGAGSQFATHVAHNNSSYTMLPKNGSHNSVIVEDGGRFQSSSDNAGDSYAVFTAYAAASSYNEFVVRGAGSRLHLTTSMYVARAGTDNALYVTNGASAYVKHKFVLGNTSTAKRNKVVVADGGAFTNANHMVIGNSAASDNEFVVSGTGSELRETTYDITIGNNADYNTLRVSDGAYLYAHRHFCVGAPSDMANGQSSATTARSTGNSAIFEGAGTGAYIYNYTQSSSYPYTDVGWFGTNNMFIVRDGASVTNRSDFRVGTGGDLAHANGAIVSNATLDITSGQLIVNEYGDGNYFKVLGGGRVAVGNNVKIGTSSANAHNGLILVSGTDSTLSPYGNSSASLTIGSAGASNVLEIADGGRFVANGQMYLGAANGTKAGNTLRVVNGTFENRNAANVALNLYGQSRLVFGGSRGVVDVYAIKAHGDNALEFVFDEDGIATLSPRAVFQIFDSNFSPTVSEIRIDASRFTAAGRTGTFTIMSTGSRSAETTDGVKLSVQSAAVRDAANAAVAALVKCDAPNVKVKSVDMANGTITVRISRGDGFILLIR